MSSTSEITSALLQKKDRSPIRERDYLSTGSTLLNLACSNLINGGFAKGHYYYFVGDSQSGKTFLALTAVAEACINPHFDEYRIIYDNTEDGALMSIRKFFGSKAAKRLEPPKGTKKEPVCSETVDDFYFNLDDCLREGPCIYILDSMDALDTEEDHDHFQERKRAARKNKEAGGSYGTSKAKKNSSDLRKMISLLRKTKSILIVIGQTRENVGSFSFDKKTRAGGKSLTFYATLEMWSSTKEKIKKTVLGKQRTIGMTAKVHTKKNRINGRDRTVFINLYNETGIDDLGSCIAYLIEENHWKGSKVQVNAPEFDFKGKIEDLITQIEEKGEEDELRMLVGKVWNEIEEKCSIKRKSRYI